jgi:hypothetical protein
VKSPRTPSGRKRERGAITYRGHGGAGA